MIGAMADRDPGDGRRRVAADFPYRSELLASLSALILLWDSPAVQGQILAKTGETIDQQSHSTLRHLLAWGPMRPTALSEVLGTGASHVSKIIRRLEDAGMVTRATDPTDGRATIITLTDAGDEAARGVYELGDRMINEVLEGWTASDVERYTALTQRFVSDAIGAADQMLERGLLPLDSRPTTADE
jgi:DNA-binding MarR family transcriptional regulator